MKPEDAQAQPKTGSQFSVSIKSAEGQNKKKKQQDRILALQEIGKDRKERQQSQDPLP
jgi:hypothetical protein